MSRLACRSTLGHNDIWVKRIHEVTARTYLTVPYRDFGEHSWTFPVNARLCTKSRSFIGFLGVKIGLSGLEKAFKMMLKRSY
jgi:hypothetical protein